MLGSKGQKKLALNWEFLGLPTLDLAHLDDQFSEEEIKMAVMDMHGEKAPGPDGFVGEFFKSCWDYIHNDLVRALQQLHALR